MSTLELFRLDKAKTFASKVIGGGPSLCRAFADEIGDFDFFALAPHGTSVDRLEQLDSGGFGDNLGTYKWIRSRTVELLGGAPSSVYVVPELWIRASSFKPEDRATWNEKFFIHDNELYYYAVPGDTAQDVDVLMRAPASFYWVGMLFRQVPHAAGVPYSSLMNGIGDVSEVHISAYDQESFVVGVRRGANPAVGRG
ncbi:MAG: hypothetical protein U1E49_09790 [Hyphomicrobiaceae bacterium]